MRSYTTLWSNRSDVPVLVGCRIKEISSIIDDLPNNIQVNHGDVKPSFIFFFAFTDGSEKEERKVFKQLVERARHMHFSLRS